MPTWLWIIIINGVVIALLGYIWKSMEHRVWNIEEEERVQERKLLGNPNLTLKDHEIICTKNTGSIERFVSESLKHIEQLIEEGEKRTALLIENIVLKAIKKE